MSYKKFREFCLANKDNPNIKPEARAILKYGLSMEVCDVRLTQGSHFDGIGAFPLAASRYGIKTMWATEIEAFPKSVSKKHFPKMKHLGDITDIHACYYVTHFSGINCEMYLNNCKDDYVKPVDVITFGSPCQDLSVAGKREGLKGERSGLFMEAIGTVHEMREATDGVYPRFIIWENVPGALSSNEGHDFRAVLEEILQTEIPMPKSGKWARAGLVRGDGCSVAWRILDAQYWGVPQRRRRIFLVADFAGQRAGEILFERKGVPRDFTESGKAREEAAACAGNSIEVSVHPRVAGTLCASGAGMSRPAGQGNETDLVVAFGPGGQNGIAHALRAQASKADKPDSTTYICEPIAFSGRQDPVSGPVAGALDTDGLSQCIAQCLTTGTGRRYDPETETLIPVLADQGGGRMSVSYGVAPTLRAQEHGHQPVVVGYPDPANTLLAKANMSFRDDQDTICVVDVRSLYETPELSGTLQSKNGGGYSLNYQSPVRIGYAVRRLTPTECERLMGFPDGWTDIDGGSDTARYKALGNSIAVPCLEFIYSQLVKVEGG